MAKTDRLDARLLAELAEVLDRSPKRASLLHRPSDAVRADLKARVARRRQLIEMRTAETHRLDTAARQPALFNERKNERVAARVELLETLLATLSVASDFEPDRSDRTRQAQSHIVRIAEDYALSHSDDHLHVSDLCRAAAVSERTLEYAFREVMGLTPVAYLTRLRLHRVRQALLAATHGSTTVSSVALDWGFWHFGEFSRAYKECFGELPADTLRCKPSAVAR